MDLRQFDVARLMQSLNEGLYIVDRQRKILFWNKAAEEITGYTAEEVVGSSCADNILVHVNDSGEKLCLCRCPLQKAIDEDTGIEDDVFLHHKQGHRVPVSVRVLPLKNHDGETIGGVEMFTESGNRTSILERLRELERLAMVDDLTQLANRRYIDLELKKAIEEYRRIGIRVGILLLDADNFKAVNDTRGHGTGDEVLRMLGRVLISNSRPFDMFGRIGGEEFIGIIKNIESADLERYGNRIRILIEKSGIVSGTDQVSITVSMGGTLVMPGDTPETILDRVDALLYRSKKAGKNRLTMG